MCVYSLRYLVCNAHTPYCHLWPVGLYTIFLHYFFALSHKQHFFSKKNPY